jgi:hypothetical protein
MTVRELIQQKSYEHVVYVLRRHWLTFFVEVLFMTLLLFVPVVVWFLLSSIYPTLFLVEAWRVIGILGGSIYYLATLVFLFTHFIDFYLDVWIVTNDRIIDMEQFGLFSRTISELDLFQIQDVTTEITGFIATMFNYGDVTVQTASNNSSIVFRKVPNPNMIRRRLIELSHDDRKYHMGQTVTIEPTKK